MLKQRILTAIILIPIVVSAILFLPTPYLAILFALLCIGGAIEWAKLSGMDECAAMAVYPLFIMMAIGGCYWLKTQNWELYLLGPVSLFWLVMMPVLLARRKPIGKDSGLNIIFLMIGLILLSSTWLSLTLLHHHNKMGAGILLFVLVLIWVADSGAYFTGKKFGKNKLAPVVSPGKTREGLYGALAFGLIWSLGYYWYQPYDGVNLGEFIALCVLVVVVSMVGDLFESLLKRKRDIKDSGHILPGHGGILDRVDSIIAAAPVFYTGLILLEKV